MACVRVMKLEVTGLAKEDRQRWKRLCERCQEMTNMLWTEWLVWHATNGSRQKIADYLEAMRAWHEAGKDKEAKKNRGPKPKLDVQPIPKELGKKLYALGSERFGDLAERARSLTERAWNKSLAKKKAVSGSLSGWMAILLNREGLPSATKPLPTPFDCRNCKLIPPTDSKSNWKVELRLSAVENPGKKRRTSVVDEVELWTKGMKRRSQAETLRKCVTVEYKFCGSKMSFDKSNGKVFLLLCYERPADVADVDQEKVAFLRACKGHPWKLRLPGRNRWPGGKGYPVEAIRRQTILQRRGRQHGYRSASSARKGHGKERAIKPLGAYARKWREFVKRFNHNTMSDVVRQCVEAGVGTLVVFQPEGERRDSLFLTTAGKVEGIHENSGWDWFQAVTLLQQKCEKSGVRLVWRRGKEVVGKAA